MSEVDISGIRFLCVYGRLIGEDAADSSRRSLSLTREPLRYPVAAIVNRPKFGLSEAPRASGDYGSAIAGKDGGWSYS